MMALISLFGCQDKPQQQTTELVTPNTPILNYFLKDSFPHDTSLYFNRLAAQQKSENPNAEVMNGIAYDSAADKVYITGKLWSKIYQIEISHF